MGHFSMEKPPNPGSVLGGNQQTGVIDADGLARLLEDIFLVLAFPQKAKSLLRLISKYLDYILADYFRFHRSLEKIKKNRAEYCRVNIAFHFP
jgi:hypothetical protein